MKLRLAAPSLLVDVSELDELRGIEAANGTWRIGPGTRHAELQSRDDLGVVAHAASLIADQQVRNRGTIGGSIAHADPASDLPTVLLAAEGSVEAQGPSGSRTIAAADLFQDYLTTSLAADEVITGVTMPSLDGWSWGYEKFARRSEDWAMVGVCALVKASGGQVRGRAHRAHPHGLHPTPRHRGRGRAARRLARRRRDRGRRPSRPPRAPTRPAT